MVFKADHVDMVLPCYKTDCLIAFLLSTSYISAIPATLAAVCLSNFRQIRPQHLKTFAALIC